MSGNVSTSEGVRRGKNIGLITLRGQRKGFVRIIEINGKSTGHAVVGKRGRGDSIFKISKLGGVYNLRGLFLMVVRRLKRLLRKRLIEVSFLFSILK